MVNVRTTPMFDDWFRSLSRLRVYTKVVSRIRNLEKGNFGDCKPVGSGVLECRIHSGPGYRLYFLRRGCDVVVLLAGGDKSTQRRDIAMARRVADEL